MATDKEIGERLRQARKAAGFASATAAALALGMKYPTYAGHENGNRGLRANLEQYSRRFQVSMAWLLTGRGDGPGRNLSADQQEAIELLEQLSDADRGHYLAILRGLAGADRSKTRSDPAR